MPLYKVLAPFSGSNWGRGCYCATLICDGGGNFDCSPGGVQDNPPCLAGCICGGDPCGCTHGAGYLTNPIDIGGGANGTDIKFYGTSNILSIKTTQINDFCAVNPPPGFDFIDHGVRVDLYCKSGGQNLIGTVFYGHLQNRIANGTYSTGLWGKFLGELGPDCNCNCSDGIHVHMTRSSTSGSTNALGCYAGVAAGSTMIYQWSTGCPGCPGCPTLLDG